MISVTKLCKQYNSSYALKDVSLTVAKGTILGLLGPNGAGKTTLVSILNGLVPYQQGEITVFGLGLDNNLKEIRSRSAFIPQSFAFYEKLTVMENLQFFAAIQQISGVKLHQSLEKAITTNRLQSILNQRANTLSGGQKQRLNIGIGLLNDPELLYLDEPTAGVDPELRHTILDSIIDLKEEGKTIIYTSHYMQEIEQICDEAAIIDQGQIISHTPLDTLLQQGDSAASLESVYLSLTARGKR